MQHHPGESKIPAIPKTMTQCLHLNQNVLVLVNILTHYGNTGHKGAVRGAILYTAIPYSASTGPEQGFPCVVFPHMEKPVFIIGFPGDKNRFFPAWIYYTGKTLFSLQGWVCSVLQSAINFVN